MSDWGYMYNCMTLNELREEKLRLMRKQMEYEDSTLYRKESYYDPDQVREKLDFIDHFIDQYKSNTSPVLKTTP